MTVSKITMTRKRRLWLNRARTIRRSAEILMAEMMELEPQSFGMNWSDYADNIINDADNLIEALEPK